MIEATKAYKTSDGMTFPSVDKAQAHELAIIIGDSADNTEATSNLIAKSDDVIAILKLKPRKSKAKAAKAVKVKAPKPAKPDDASL